MIHVLIEGFGASGFGWQIAAIGSSEMVVTVCSPGDELHPSDILIVGPDSSRSPHESASTCGARILLQVDELGSDGHPGGIGRSKLAKRWSVPLDAEGFGSIVVHQYMVTCHSVQALHPPRRTHGPGAPLSESGLVKMWDEELFRGVGVEIDQRVPEYSREIKLAMEGRRPLPILPGVAFCLPRSVAVFPVESGGETLKVSGLLCHSMTSALGFVLITVPELVSMMGYAPENAESLDWKQIRALTPIPFARSLLSWCLESARKLPEK